MNWYLGIFAIALWLGATVLYFSRQIRNWVKRSLKRRAADRAKPKVPTV